MHKLPVDRSVTVFVRFKYDLQAFTDHLLAREYLGTPEKTLVTASTDSMSDALQKIIEIVSDEYIKSDVWRLHDDLVSKTGTKIAEGRSGIVIQGTNIFSKVCLQLRHVQK